jgi:hypothetical protein
MYFQLALFPHLYPQYATNPEMVRGSRGKGTGNAIGVFISGNYTLTVIVNGPKTSKAESHKLGKLPGNVLPEVH